MKKKLLAMAENRLKGLEVKENAWKWPKIVWKSLQMCSKDWKCLDVTVNVCRRPKLLEIAGNG